MKYEEWKRQMKSRGLILDEKAWLQRQRTKLIMEKRGFPRSDAEADAWLGIIDDVDDFLSDLLRG